MPELPEVETVCRGLEKPLLGQTIDRVDQRRKDLRIPFPERLKARLEGQTVDRLYRRAKYILIDLSGGETLILHLGMSGRILIYDAAPVLQKHDHLVISTRRGKTVVFHDPRRFGLVDLTAQTDIATHRLFKNLGPEPLGNRLSGPDLYKILKRKTTSMKAALLDQRVIAGLGNIYVCEALFEAGIRPTRRADKVTQAQSARLVCAIQGVLTRAIAAGGSSLKDYRQTDGALGYFQHHWAVYDQEGGVCPRGCVQPIKRIVQSGRSSFYCPGCQK